MGEDLRHLINGCIDQDRKYQKLLYKAFYSFAMGICQRYSSDHDTAKEIANQGFLKVLTNIKKYDPDKPFEAWVGRIMVNTAIDHYRASLRTAFTFELDEATNINDEVQADANINYTDLLKMVQQLPPASRTVFNLFAIEGYTHEEISKMLSISIGTSKSNLHKARHKLKEMLLKESGYKNEEGYRTGIHNTPAVAAINGIAIRHNYLN